MERREHERYRIWLPLQVRSETGDIMAVTYDASDSGVLMLAARALDVGARVTVTMELPGEPPKQRRAGGRVVRVGPNEDDPYGLWPYRLAVEMDETMEAFQAELEALARSGVMPIVTR